MKTVKQLIKEYRIPFAIACVWTAINFYKKESNALSFVNVDILNIFGASFILISWFSEQYFRIAEQVKVEDSLEKIEKRAKEIFDSIEVRTLLIFSQMTGGTSFCYVNVAENYLGIKNLVVSHQGEYPLYDLTLRVVDLDKFNEHSGNPEYAHTYEKSFFISTLLPKQDSFLHDGGFFNQAEGGSFNIFFSARNGMFHELLRYKKINNEWVTAIKVEGEKTLLESVADNYPKNTAGEVDW